MSTVSTTEVKVSGAQAVITLAGKIAIVTGSSRYVSHHLSISI
jgi:hypothetical protein